MKLLIDKTYRGGLYVTDLTLEKSIKYALKGMKSKITIHDVTPFLVEDSYLHIQMQITPLSNETNLAELIREIQQSVKDWLLGSIGIKPKNIAIFLSSNTTTE